MRVVLFTLLMVIGSTIQAGAQDRYASSGEQIVPNSIAGLEMTLWDDRHCAKIVFLFWPQGNFTAAGMVVPGGHSYIEVASEGGTYEWRVTGSRQAFLTLRKRDGSGNTYKMTFDNPKQATGFISKQDRRPYKFTFKDPWEEAKR